MTQYATDINSQTNVFDLCITLSAVDRYLSLVGQLKNKISNRPDINVNA